MYQNQTLEHTSYSAARVLVADVGLIVVWCSPSVARVLASLIQRVTHHILRSISRSVRRRVASECAAALSCLLETAGSKSLLCKCTK
jgi:hypothetical protein